MSKKGNIPWNKGKVGVQHSNRRGKKYDEIYGEERAKKIKEKVSKNHSRHMLGKKRTFSKKWREKIGLGNKDKIVSENVKKRISETNKKVGVGKWMIGRKLPLKVRIKMSLVKRGKNTGKNNPNWQGGKSFEPYGLEFNEDLKEVIRNRDRRKCQICEKTELDNGKRLSIHHINYNKQNNNPNNLISLCRNCHIKTNHKRENWMNYFRVAKLRARISSGSL